MTCWPFPDLDFPVRCVRVSGTTHIRLRNF